MRWWTGALAIGSAKEVDGCEGERCQGLRNRGLPCADQNIGSTDNALDSLNWARPPARIPSRPAVPSGQGAWAGLSSLPSSSAVLLGAGTLWCLRNFWIDRVAGGEALSTGCSQQVVVAGDKDRRREQFLLQRLAGYQAGANWMAS